uniref:Uncharacterized protein n=1 Tax=Rhizophora mucronata TaxID=61149 RepID=A0A2P2NEI1_RHIMU
MFTLERKT